MSFPSFQFQHYLHDISSQNFLGLLHSCVDDICGKKPHQQYESFKSCTSWSKEEYESVYASLKQLFQAVLSCKTPEQVILQNYPGIESEHLNCILDCLKVRRNDIIDIMIQNSCAISGQKLQDYDWNLKWVMGSSTLASLRQPLLSLDLSFIEDHTSNIRSINLELDPMELKMLLTALENAQSKIER